MTYCCPFCGVWSLGVLGMQVWKNPDGGRAELCAMRCGACRSLVLADPTAAAIDTVKDRLAAAWDRRARAASAMERVASA